MAHLLVLGASGISGWAVMQQARTYPTPTTFAKITGTTNRPMTLEQALLPPDDERLRLVGGVDFTKPVEEVKASLKEKIPDIDTVTHIIYTGELELEEERKSNARTMSRGDVKHGKEKEKEWSASRCS